MADVDRLRELIAINRAISESLEYEEVARLVVEKTATFIEADACLLLLLDDETRARVVAAVGVDEERARRFSAPLDQGLSAALRHFLGFGPAGAFLTVQVTHQADVQGILAVYRRGREAVEPEVEFLLSALADQAAIALGHALRYQKARRDQDRKSEEQLRLITDAAPVLIAYCDADRRFRFVNRGYAERFGLSPEEIVGRTIPEVVGEAAYETFRRHVDTALSGQAAEYEVEVPYRDIGVRYMRVSYVPDFGAGGEVCGYTAAISDITDRRQMEEALRRQNQRLGLLSDAAGHLLSTGDPDRMARDLFERVSAEPGLGAYFNLMLNESGDALRLESCSEISEEDLEVLKTICHYVAIAKERARLTAELAERADRLVEADRRKDEFLAMLAHELRNPLASVSNAVHLLKLQGHTDPRLTRTREIIERQVGHQVRLVDDLLDVSRITRGKIELRRIRFDLSRLVRDTAEDHRGIVEAAGLTLFLDLPVTPVWVDGDPARLAQVVGNLLHNAAKFTDPGGHVAVCLTADPVNGRAECTVRDTGVGIHPEMLPCVFDTFAQADRSLDRSRGGLGLGLALVKGLVALHGGDVRAESDGQGLGAAFTLELPMVPCPAAIEPASRPPGPVAGTIRILIVEDNPDMADTLREVLELSGCTAEVAYSGPEAVERARRFRPEVVLCDLGLPEMDGYQVAAALRKDPTTATVRLIAVSGYGREEDKRRSREAGFDLHLTKPVGLDDLQRLLEVGPELRAV